MMARMRMRTETWEKGREGGTGKGRDGMREKGMEWKAMP